MVISGSSLFPFLLRNLILLGHRLSPWRYKIVFDYLILNHHHLSTLLYPTLQTRIYLFITFLLYLMAISISLILDLNNRYLSEYSVGIRILIFVFHAVSARFAGFQTIDISHLTSATLIIYLLLMITKPQMLCTLKKSRFELAWVSLRTNEKEGDQINQEAISPRTDSIGNIQVLRQRRSSIASDQVFVSRQMNLYLDRQRIATKERADKSKRYEKNGQKHRQISYLHFRLFFLKFAQIIFKEAMVTFSRTRTWLLIGIFLVCAIEHGQIAMDPNITVFKVVFEFVSAFGCVGLSLGYPGVTSSFATVLSPVSQVIIGLTMLMGRHRGLFTSFKDQEEIAHNANELLNKCKEELINEYEESQRDELINTRL